MCKPNDLASKLRAHTSKLEHRIPMQKSRTQSLLCTRPGRTRKFGGHSVSSGACGDGADPQHHASALQQRRVLPGT
eukprot:4582362-Pleurochrysis_carterae.AAC.2